MKIEFRKYTDKKTMESAAVGIKYEIVDSLPTISVNDTEENLIIVKKGETKEPTK